MVQASSTALEAEPRFLDVSSYAVYQVLLLLRRFGPITAAVTVTVAALLTLPHLIASSRGKPSELPSIFGSVGLPINHSPFDRDYRRAAVPGGGRSWNYVVTRARQISDPLERLQFVHKFVVGHVQYEEDTLLYRSEDHWATPSETLVRQKGDCEDYAILELMILKAAGINGSQIYLTVGHDLVARRDHAILTVKIGEQLWTSDQRAHSIYPMAAVTDFRAIMTLSEDRAWLHGYKKRPAERFNSVGR